MQLTLSKERGCGKRVGASIFLWPSANIAPFMSYIENFIKAIRHCQIFTTMQYSDGSFSILALAFVFCNIL